MVAIQPLPDVATRFMSAEELLEGIRRADDAACRDADGAPMLTILDFRNENFMESKVPPRIKSGCRTIFLKLDDLRRSEARSQIPRNGLVVTITETGNRDAFVMRYLSLYDFSNVQGLQFGMRGWLKLRYPIE